MKLTQKIAALALVVGFMASAAHAEGFSGMYAGAGLGLGYRTLTIDDTDYPQGSDAPVNAFVGYNHKMGKSPVVAGLEIGLNYDMDGGRRSIAPQTLAGQISSVSSYGIEGYVDGKMGYEFNKTTMVYGKVGYSYTDSVSMVSVSQGAGAVVTLPKQNTVWNGLRLGFGVETFFTKSMSGSFEGIRTLYNKDNSSLVNSYAVGRIAYHF